MFNVVVKKFPALKITCEVLVVPVVDLNRRPEGLPSGWWETIKKQAQTDKFQPEWGVAKIWFKPWAGAEPGQAFALIGLGQSAGANVRAEGLRRGLGRVSREVKRQSLRSLALYLDGADTLTLASAAVEALALAEYRYDEYSPKLKEENRRTGLKNLFIFVAPRYATALKKQMEQVRNVLSGVALARDLVNRPAADIAPKTLVAQARAIVAGQKNIKVKVFSRAQVARLGMRAFLAVAQGSDEPPALIHLTYKPRRKARRKIFIVGKGITFDSGGLSLKPAPYMEIMRCDMAGAAAVLGLFSILKNLDVPYEIHGVIAAAENMPSGKAYRPGDILRAKNGKTIEVVNTDAEGRLTLADALSYASDFKPDVIVDVATLTGACMVALGETVAGLFGNNENLLTELKAAADVTGEALASLPMPEEYREIIESRVADLRNTGSSSYGDAILAAMFLREFVGEKISWAHIDIAGPAFAERPRLSYHEHGATGFGVRLLVSWLTSSGQKRSDPKA